MMNSTFLRWVLVLLLCSALSACVTPAAPPLPDSPMNARITDPDARRQLQLGNPKAAADIYSQRALRISDPATQQDYLLIASEILFDRGLMEQAQEKLSDVPTELATLDLAHRRDILLAKSFVFERDAEAALAALPDPIVVDTALNRGRVFETQAQAYEILQDPDNELIARINLEGQLNDPAIIERSHQQIWQLLTTQSLSTLRGMTTNVRGDTYQGWIELALGHASAGIDAQVRQTSVNNWRQRFPSHPANPGFVATLYAGNGFDANTSAQPIDQIAILLPLSGRNTAVVAAAIRDGLMAAHQQSNNAQIAPTLRFYDVGDNPGYVRTAYKNAIADGADAVIGPLRKEAVAAVVSQQEIPVTTITLNTVETAAVDSEVSNIIQFGLAPEDEAVAAASRAAGLGFTNAIVFQTDDSRGDREARAFRDALYLYGGDVAHIAVLPADTYDYSKEIKEALAIDESDARFSRLRRTLGKKMFFEPSIRSDVDVIFLAVTNEQARSVRTQLDFFYARQLTRLGTSRVAGADEDQKKNADLNTIFYPEAPWVLRKSLDNDPLKAQILATFDNAEGVYGKLYALGADAYSLVTNLDKISAGERLQGYTGELELRSDGRIQRYLDWAQYVEGVSQNVKSVDAPSLPSLRSNVIN
ncbi:MAG: penicillin-binding protein activator [Granulosicoccus sp.]